MKVILTRKNLAAARARAAKTPPRDRPTGGQESTLTEAPLPPPEGAPDSYVQRVYKLIPAEVTAGYIALLSGVGLIGDHAATPATPTAASAVAHADDTTRWAPLVAIIVGTLWAILALRADGASQRPAVTPLRRQYALTVLAFWAWGASISDPLRAFDAAIPSWILFFAIVLIPSLGAYWLAEADE